MKYKKNVGNAGEDYSATILENMGYRIIERNYWTKLGEIDIVAVKGDELHFIEVKTRTQIDFGFPAESINKDKQRRMRRVADIYISLKNIRGMKISLDVMEIHSNLIINCM